MKKKFSLNWKNSVHGRKQRKYRFNAPLHIKQNFIRAHLSKDLRKARKRRSAGLRKGDKVKIMRGTFRGKSGKVESVDLKKSRVYVTGIEIVKKDGSKVLYPLEPSNLLITELKMDDKMRHKSVGK